MEYFSGTLNVRIFEAAELKPTACATRHSIRPAAKLCELLDPYVTIDVDDIAIGKSSTKSRTNTPQWNEDVCAEVNSAQRLTFTVYHDAAIPPDDFVAIVEFAIRNVRSGEEVWLELEPQGKLHIRIDLAGTRTDEPPRDRMGFPGRDSAIGGVHGKHYRCGAMRRRIHQAKGHKFQVCSIQFLSVNDDNHRLPVCVNSRSARYAIVSFGASGIRVISAKCAHVSCINDATRM